MAKIISIANQKGGVGKTTTCVNLCSALCKQGKRVLLCDMDPQGNATSSMGIAKRKVHNTTYDVISGQCAPRDAVIETKYGDVMPSNSALSGAGIELVNTENREYILKNALNTLQEEYDFILIDCPPSLEMLTVNALCASHSILVPVQCEYFALEGLSDLMNTIRIIKKQMNPDFEMEGVVLTMYDGRTNLSFQVAAEVKKYFKEKVFRTVIPRNVRLSEAPSHGKPAIAYDFSSRGAQAYIELAGEIINNNKRWGK